MNRPIDLEHLFHHYVADHLHKAGKLDEDAAGEMAEKLYAEWADAPCAALDGCSPRAWFARLDTPEALVEALTAYARADMEPPELLLDRFFDVGAVCAAPLEALARDGGESAALRAQALDLLNGLDEARAVRTAIDAVLAARESNAFCELAAEILAGRVDADIADRLLDGYDAAPDFARTLILETLCNFPGDARVYERMLEMLKNRPEQRADAARLLGRYGDARAIEPLKALLDLTDIGYYEYMEVRNAVEALGGEVENEREFYGDPDYEYLRELE